MMRTGIVLAIVAGLASAAGADPGSWDSHHGVTLELHGGAGVFAIGSDSGMAITDPVPLAVHVAVGGFVTPRLAIAGQLTTSTILHDEEGVGSETLTAIQVGPAAQLWVLPFAWVGAGAGLAKVSYERASMSAFGVDARAGIALPAHAQNSWDLTLEGTTTFGADHDWVTAAVLIGYQYL